MTLLELLVWGGIPWTIGVALWCRIWYRHRKISPLIAQLKLCNRELRKALERGDLEAAERWSERFREIEELVTPMVNKRF